MTTWQPIVYRGGKLCGHTATARGVEGYWLDCDAPAVFVRTTEYGTHEYACAEHAEEEKP